MKSLLFDGKPRVRINPARERAMTLVEIMTAMGVFGLVFMALLYAQMFGLRQDELVESKLGASDQSRKSFELICRDVRCANTTAIGNVSNPSNPGGTFTAIPNGTLQQGNAVQICRVAGSTTYLYYYFDTTSTPGTNMLRRYHTGDATSTILATCLSTNNGIVLNFDSEDFTGAYVSDLSNKRVIHFTLGFAQYQYPLTKVGSQYLYDFYKMEFRVTPHVSDGQ